MSAAPAALQCARRANASCVNAPRADGRWRSERSGWVDAAEHAVLATGSRVLCAKCGADYGAH